MIVPDVVFEVWPELHWLISQPKVSVQYIFEILSLSFVMSCWFWTLLTLFWTSCHNPASFLTVPRQMKQIPSHSWGNVSGLWLLPQTACCDSRVSFALRLVSGSADCFFFFYPAAAGGNKLHCWRSSPLSAHHKLKKKRWVVWSPICSFKYLFLMTS